MREALLVLLFPECACLWLLRQSDGIYVVLHVCPKKSGTVVKKQDTKLLFISLPDIDRFFKSFHCCTQQKICNKRIITDPTIAKRCRYTACEILVYKSCINRKHSNSRPGVRILKRMLFNALNSTILCRMDHLFSPAFAAILVWSVWRDACWRTDCSKFPRETQLLKTVVERCYLYSFQW